MAQDPIISKEELLAPSPKSKKEDDDLFKAHQKAKRKLIHRIFLIGVSIAAASIGLMFIVRIIHFIAPENTWLYWLSDEQIQSIDRFLFSGAIGAIVGKYFDEIFNSNDYN